MIRREVQIGDFGGLVSFEGFSKTAIIYGIKDDSGAVVYVGATTRRIQDRIRGHIADAVSGSAILIHNWMRDRGYRFHVVLLEQVPPSEMDDAERRWIANLNLTGCLLNQTKGGPGCVGYKFSEDRNRRMAETLRRGAHFNCEVCATQFWRKPRDIKKGNSRFCSRACYQTWQRGKSKGKTA